MKFEGRISRAHDFGRSPCGERGLKLDLDPDLKTEKSSLPMRGAWIEIMNYGFLGTYARSLPMRGAWIEILICLKSTTMPFVAPHAGSVD